MSFTREQVEMWQPSGMISEDGDYYLAYGPLGTQIYLNKEDKSLTPCLLREPFWESWVTAWMTRNLPKHDVFLDIGANCGYYTALAQAYSVETHAFEPNPSYSKMLRKTLEHNAFPSAYVYNYALADTEGTLPLEIPTNLHGSASLKPINEGFETVTIDVPVITLDSFYFPDRSVLIKMDVEKAEEMVWNGGKRFMAEHDVTLVMEWTPDTYSDAFYGDLSAYGTVNLLNHQGHEELISETALRGSEWHTIVVRKHD